MSNAYYAAVRRWPRDTWVGRFGVVLGLFAFLVTLPPFRVNAPFVPVLIGLLAFAAGIWALSRSQARPGWTAIGFLGIAVALLGRNTALGVGLSALLFGALLYGTTHGLQSGTIDPSLAGHLTEMIQGLVVLFVGADLLIIAVWNARKRLRRGRGAAGAAAAELP